MNAGTKLGEMSRSVKAIRMVSFGGRVVDYPAAELAFGYRHAQLPPGGIVVGARLRAHPVPLQLAPGSSERITQSVKDYLRYRKATQPLMEPNAGCVFKNPAPNTAGGLIEQAGLKGCRVGAAEVSTKHANFIVNRGGAKAADVTALIAKVKRVVKARTGLALALELHVIGER